MIRKIMPNVVFGQDVLLLGGEKSVQEAANAMAQRDIHAVLIVEGDKLVGLFTGTDLVRKVVANGLRPDHTKLKEVMTEDPQTVTPDTDAIEALHLMQDGKFRHLPVLENGKVVGIVSRKDFLSLEIEELGRQEKLWEEM